MFEIFLLLVSKGFFSHFSMHSFPITALFVSVFNYKLVRLGHQ